MGKGKRDLSLFSEVADDLGLLPSAILFIDDNRDNMARAMTAGMQAIEYKFYENTGGQPAAGSMKINYESNR